MPTEQDILIGVHPTVPHIFGNWLNFEDINVLDTKPNKKHRKLSEISGQRNTAIEALANWIVEHHVSIKRLERINKRKAAILTKYGISLENYLDDQHLFPRNESTKSGNATEILLVEYLKATSGLELLVFRLHYNPNVDQSMKGDDCLLFQKSDLSSKVIVGEAKFRSTPSKVVIEEMINNLQEGKKNPISLSFVSAVLSEMNNEDMADKIDDLQYEIAKGRVPVTNVGFLLSTMGKNKSSDAALRIESDFDTTNESLVVLSLGVDNPQEIITKAFDLAKTKLLLASI